MRGRIAPRTAWSKHRAENLSNAGAANAARSGRDARRAPEAHVEEQAPEAQSRRHCVGRNVEREGAKRSTGGCTKRETHTNLLKWSMTWSGSGASMVPNLRSEGRGHNTQLQPAPARESEFVLRVGVNRGRDGDSSPVRQFSLTALKPSNRGARQAQPMRRHPGRRKRHTPGE